MTQHDATGRSGNVASPSTGELLAQLSDEVSRLVRDELRLAQAEVSGKAKKAGTGVGMFGVAGLLALYGLAVLIATAILALALVLEAWLAALVVGVALLAIAGVAALAGKRRVDQATPPLPTLAMEGVKEDVDVLRHSRDHH